MCVVSMVMGHFQETLEERLRRLQESHYLYRPLPQPPITDDEIKDFRRLLERAREYDRKMNQPDCELEEKRQKIRQLAKELGVEVEFV